MFWKTAVTSVALTGLAWGACPPGGLPTVGGPLTRSCLLTPVAGADQKAGSKKDLVDRGDVGNAVRDFVKDVLSEGGLQSLASDVQAVQQEGAGEYALNKARAYGDRALHSVVSSLVNTAKKRSDSDFFKNLDVTYDYNFGDTKTWTATVSTLFSLWKTKSNLVFSQVNVLYTEKRPTVNVGVGDRYMNPGHTFLVGANAFFDYDFKGKNSRVSVGAEGMVKYAKVSANYYRHISDWHKSPFQNHDGSVLSVQERAADGFDVRLKGYMPFYPQIAATARFYQWYGDKVNLFSLNDTAHGTKDPKGYAVGVAYRPNSLLNLGVEYAHGVGNKQKSTRVTFGANYQFGVPFKQQMAFTTPLMDVSAHLYDKVDRENRIILARKDSLKVSFDKLVYRGNIVNSNPISISVVMSGEKASTAKLSWSIPPETKKFMDDPKGGAHAVFDPSRGTGQSLVKGKHYSFTVTASLPNGDKVSQTAYVVYMNESPSFNGGRSNGVFQNGLDTQMRFPIPAEGAQRFMGYTMKFNLKKASLRNATRNTDFSKEDISWDDASADGTITPKNGTVVSSAFTAITITPKNGTFSENKVYKVEASFTPPAGGQGEHITMDAYFVVKPLSFVMKLSTSSVTPGEKVSVTLVPEGGNAKTYNKLHVGASLVKFGENPSQGDIKLTLKPADDNLPLRPWHDKKYTVTLPSKLPFSQYAFMVVLGTFGGPEVAEFMLPVRVKKGVSTAHTQVNLDGKEGTVGGTVTLHATIHQLAGGGASRGLSLPPVYLKVASSKKELLYFAPTFDGTPVGYCKVLPGAQNKWLNFTTSEPPTGVMCSGFGGAGGPGFQRSLLGTHVINFVGFRSETPKDEKTWRFLDNKGSIILHILPKGVNGPPS